MHDYPALTLTIVVALIISASLFVAHRDGNNRRGLLVAGALAAGLIAVAVVDLLLYTPRETHFTAVIIGISLPVLGTVAFLRATRPMRRPWLRALLTFVVAFVLLVGGLQIGTTLASRLLPF